MKFRIWKTSDDWNKPCDGAILVQETTSDKWYLKKRIWEIEINTLEDLIELTRQSKKNAVIIFADENDIELEIYDDYRE